MTFTSLLFAGFFLVVLAAYWTVARRHQNLLLLVASCAFYGSADYRLLGLLALSTATAYLTGLVIARSEDDRRRRQMVALNVVVNIGMLAAFKYADSFEGGVSRVLDFVGLSTSETTLQILLPLGISFYTFKAVGYTVDVYRGRATATDNVLDFAVFMAYFPALVSGPIERTRRFLPQVARRRRSLPEVDDVRSATMLIAQGLFKKWVVADTTARIAQEAFAFAPEAGSVQLLLGAYALTIQVYADLSGYTDIARGVSRLLGLELMENFRHPFLSRNVAQFWRGWHISLSTWMRDYVYASLPARNEWWRRANLVVTFTLIGLWHGAAWTFVAWGALNGVWLVAHEIVSRRRAPSTNAAATFVATVLTFHGVVLGGVFFGAPSMRVALEYLGRMFGLEGAWSLMDTTATLWLLLPLAAAVLGLDLLHRRRKSPTPLLGSNVAVRGLSYGVIAAAILVFGGAAVQPFVYARF